MKKLISKAGRAVALIQAVVFAGFLQFPVRMR